MERRGAVLGFLITFGIGAMFMAGLILGTDRFELHRTMHVFTSEEFDGFFRLFTHAGDGVTPTIIALALLLLRNVRSFLMMALSCTLSAVLVQTLKHGPFSECDRPVMFKEQLGELHWLEGIELHAHFSFPSGHATAAFSMCFALAVLIGRPVWGVALAFCAMLIAYSRVYLNQHFSEDILAGAGLGVATALLVYLFLYQSGFSRRAWLTRRLMEAKSQA